MRSYGARSVTANSWKTAVYQRLRVSCMRTQTVKCARKTASFSLLFGMKIQQKHSAGGWLTQCKQARSN